VAILFSKEIVMQHFTPNQKSRIKKQEERRRRERRGVRQIPQAYRTFAPPDRASSKAPSTPVVAASAGGTGDAGLDFGSVSALI